MRALSDGTAPTFSPRAVRSVAFPFSAGVKPMRRYARRKSLRPTEVPGARRGHSRDIVAIRLVVRRVLGTGVAHGGLDLLTVGSSPLSRNETHFQ